MKLNYITKKIQGLSVDVLVSNCSQKEAKSNGVNTIKGLKPVVVVYDIDDNYYQGYGNTLDEAINSAKIK